MTPSQPDPMRLNEEEREVSALTHEALIDSIADRHQREGEIRRERRTVSNEARNANP
jgi:hypothetical protein